MSPKKPSGANAAVNFELVAQLNDEVQRQALFFKKFIKEFSDETPLRWWVYFAGAGGLCEVARLLVDVWKYFAH